MKIPYKWQATLVVCLGMVMAILDSTIVSVTLPQMQKAFHTDFATITWVASAYFLAQAAVIPIVGYLSDHIGTKTVFLNVAGAFYARFGPLCIRINQRTVDHVPRVSGHRRWCIDARRLCGHLPRIPSDRASDGHRRGGHPAPGSSGFRSHSWRVPQFDV